MQVSYDDGVLFYKLYAALLSFVNGRLNVIPEKFSDSQEYTFLPPETRLAVRDALYANQDLFDQFVQENPAQLSADELAIVAGWKDAVVGQFYIFRYLKNYTVFLSSAGKPNKAYGVLALADPFEDMIGPYLPKLVHTVLLPLKGKIIYDGLFFGHNISFGGGIKRMLNEEYKQAKQAFGIITSLPEGEPAAESPKTRSKKIKRGVASRSSNVDDRLNAVVQMTDAFCKDYLNEEYAGACRKLAEVLSRKRPSPFKRGKLEGWASGIVRMIGRVNFLDDPSQTPYLKLSVIDRAFGVAVSTGQGKAKAIRTMLKIHQFDPEWTLPSLVDRNPLVWILQVNGFLMDIRDAPRDAQVAAYEQGLIPYIPADRLGGELNTEKLLNGASSNLMESSNMPTRKHIAPDTKVGLKLTATERKLILNDIMCLDDNYTNVIRATPANQPVAFTLDDWDDFSGYIAAEANHTKDKRLGKKLDAIFDKIQKILDTHTDEEPPKIVKIEDARRLKTSSSTVYQLKITLREITPPIWRRIQVKDCTLDKLHQHIQTAMGWTNSHLHQFEIDGVRYGNPEYLCEGWEDDASLVNSLRTKLSEVVPGNGDRFRFDYEYDFGDGWAHEILFEGCLEAKKGNRYPSCIEGERACPPEDVGGPYGYEEYLAAISDPKHEEHETYMEWRGAFDPEKFDAGSTTRHMRRGLPNW